MNTKLLQYTAASLALLFSSVALAQETPSVELTVIGTINPEPCTTALGDEGVIDYGTIGAGRIQSNAETALDAKTVSLTVTCPTSTTVAFSVTENRTGTASPGGSHAAYSFGLGNVNSEGKLGRYTATLRNGKVGGSNANFASRASSTSLFSAGTVSRPLGSAVSAGQYTWVTGTSTTPLAGLVFTADVEVAAFLASRADMKGAITEDVQLDGSMTFTFTTGL